MGGTVGNMEFHYYTEILIDDSSVEVCMEVDSECRLLISSSGN